MRHFTGISRFSGVSRASGHSRSSRRAVPHAVPGACARLRLAATLPLVVVACVIASSATEPMATLAATTTAVKESLVVFEGQLHGHQVRAVTLHTKAHAFHASLEDGRRVLVVVPSSQQQQLLGDVRADGVTVKVAKAQSPSHKRRYIVGAVVIVVVLAAVGLVLFIRRRRRREEEEGPRSPAPAR